MTPEQRLANIVQTTERMARRMNAVFVLDPQKARDFLAAVRRGEA